MQRIVVVGTSGSGKSVLGEKLAKRLNVPHIDLDALHWQPNWQESPTEVFRACVTNALQGEHWVVAGNYSKVRDLIWTQADTLIWLDYQLPLIFWRLLRRTIQRITTREDLWGTGNRETWGKQFFSRDSLFLWVLKSHPRHRQEYPQLFQRHEYQHLRIFHFHSPRETENWLKTVAQL